MEVCQLLCSCCRPVPWLSLGWLAGGLGGGWGPWQLPRRVPPSARYVCPANHSKNNHGVQEERLSCLQLCVPSAVHGQRACGSVWVPESLLRTFPEGWLDLAMQRRLGFVAESRMMQELFDSRMTMLQPIVCRRWLAVSGQDAQGTS